MGVGSDDVPHRTTDRSSLLDDPFSAVLFLSSPPRVRSFPISDFSRFLPHSPSKVAARISLFDVALRRIWIIIIRLFHPRVTGGPLSAIYRDYNGQSPIFKQRDPVDVRWYPRYRRERTLYSPLCLPSFSPDSRTALEHCRSASIAWYFPRGIALNSSEAGKGRDCLCDDPRDEFCLRAYLRRLTASAICV